MDILLPGFRLNRFTAKASALDYPDGGFLRLIWVYDMRRCYLKNRFQTATAFELLSLCSMSIPTGQISWQDSDFMIIPTPRFSTDNTDIFLPYKQHAWPASAATTASEKAITKRTITASKSAMIRFLFYGNRSFNSNLRIARKLLFVSIL